jgi:sulfur carrier protein
MPDDTVSAAVRVNGLPEPLSVATVAELLQSKEISCDMRGVAVARNGELVPRAQWATTPLRAGDAIEIVIAKQGG